MNNLPNELTGLPSEQLRIRAKCMHPFGSFLEFRNEDIERSIPDRFEKQVKRFPHRTALKSRMYELTYDALNKAANSLARTILSGRKKKTEQIALVLENDAPMIIAMLAVLKAGKTYVPLDPLLPHARIKYILEDSQSTLIMTNNKNLPFAEDLADNMLPLINVDKLDPSLSTENLTLSISPNNLIWILYTSGSTGLPKGVVHNHRNVLHFIMNYTNGFHICSDDRLTPLYSSSVNAGAHDIYSALLNGATIYPLDIKNEGLTHLANWLVSNKITIYSSVPTVFAHFLDTLTGKERFPELRLIKMMGEAVYKRHVDLYKKHFSDDCIFVNRLGSTETGSIRWFFIDKETQISAINVPVGYSVADNEILLLDDDDEEVSLGQIGEIAVKSRYLTPGYWHKPDYTDGTFLLDPEGDDKLIYRTGDLGRMLPDGCLMAVGRKDFQVKIRGYRVEVAEVEMALLDHDAVKEAVVCAREDRPGDKRLVAYIVPAVQRVPDINELRGFLTGTLPDYMIPSTFVVLDTLPLAPNGKVNRRALPTPDTTRPNLKEAFVAPRTTVEKKLARIWSEALNREQIGTHDNFFVLGGYSLLATRVISRLRDTFHIEIPLRAIFEKPTVAGLTELIETVLWASDMKNNATDVETHDEEIGEI